MPGAVYIRSTFEHGALKFIVASTWDVAIQPLYTNSGKGGVWLRHTAREGRTQAMYLQVQCSPPNQDVYNLLVDKRQLSTECGKTRSSHNKG